VSATEPLARGTQIAPGYEVIAHMRRGRALDVYDVWSHDLGARCIVKAIRPERLDDERTRSRLLEEGRRLEAMSHPHIVRGYETLERPHPMVVMETLTGATLGYLIEESSEPMAVESVAHLGLHLASAVRYLNARDILHLDLKPANVVAEGTRAKVIDLSVARAPGDIPGGVGTWCYLAPEQATDGFVGPPADVWGIGTVLFEVATGTPAFEEPEDDGREGAREEEDEDFEDEEDEEGDDLEELDEDSPWSEDDETTPSWLETGDGPYPQLEQRAQRVDDVRDVPTPLADLVAACLDPEPPARPTVHELLAGLEPFSGMPTEERHWSRLPRDGP
jgi:eukaryotic-like serine/threonine-protein kinase